MMSGHELTILNVGCGTKTADGCVNVDWSPYLLLKKRPMLRALATPFIGGLRRERLEAMSDNVLVHDLRKPLPYPDGSVDGVYHSHVLEHIDRDSAEAFMAEIHRVLRPGGIQRVCVPDWEHLCRTYLDHVTRCETSGECLAEHDARIGHMIEQCVRKEAFGSRQRPPWLRRMERVVLGDARARGETHQWMYDRFNLRALLESAGFREVAVCRCNQSAIPGWQAMNLELDENGAEYKPGSLYMECRK